MRIAILSVALALAVAAFACGGGTSGPPTPAGTPTLPPPATIDAARADDFRAFAAEIDAALQSEDESFFLERAVTLPVVCTKELVESPRLGGPVCESADETYEGLVTGRWRTDGNVIPVDSAIGALVQFHAQSLPEESDEYGAGAPRVYALVLGEDAAHAILSGLIERPPGFVGEGPLRIAFLTTWTFQDERWRMTYLVEAAAQPEELLIPCQPLLDFLRTDDWQRYPDPTAPRGDQEDCPL